MSESSQITVTTATPTELLLACRYYFGAVLNPAQNPKAERCAVGLLNRENARLFLTRAGDAFAAVTVAEALPGALGVVWLPVGEAPEPRDAVLRVACEWLRERGVKVCQVFGASDDPREPELLACGFQRTTELVFLRRDFAPEDATREQPLTLTFVPVCDARDTTVRDVLLATHHDSRDCPELNANRDAEELLAGFTGSANTEWALAYFDGEPVGVVMFEVVRLWFLADITYLGVLPAFRGRGFGLQLVDYVLEEARGTGATGVEVSVDARNEPAMRLYRERGFTETSRQCVWLRVFRI